MSSFGLQQLPAPDAGLAAWVRALAPGGVLAVVFWQAHDDPDDPLARAAALVRERFGGRDPAWQHELAARATEAGLRIERDELVAHRMHHPDAASLWDALVEAGPWQSLARRVGTRALAPLRDHWRTALPPGPLTHTPTARLLIGTRAPANL